MQCTVFSYSKASGLPQNAAQVRCLDVAFKLSRTHPWCRDTPAAPRFCYCQGTPVTAQVPALVAYALPYMFLPHRSGMHVGHMYSTEHVLGQPVSLGPQRMYLIGSHEALIHILQKSNCTHLRLAKDTRHVNLRHLLAQLLAWMHMP